MFLIEAHREGRTWVSGIFEHRETAKAYLQEIPSPLIERQSIREVGPGTFPVFVVEDSTGFTAMSANEVQQLASQTSPADDGDATHFNLYLFSSDWHPPRPGTDYMGVIPHVHVANGDLKLIIQLGATALF